MIIITKPSKTPVASVILCSTVEFRLHVCRYSVKNAAVIYTFQLFIPSHSLTSNLVKDFCPLPPIVPAVRLSIVGRSALTVAGACIWNDLHSHISDITSSPSLLTFKQRLKCTYFVAPTPVLPFNCFRPLWSLK